MRTGKMLVILAGLSLLLDCVIPLNHQGKAHPYNAGKDGTQNSIDMGDRAMQSTTEDANGGGNDQLHP